MDLTKDRKKLMELYKPSTKKFSLVDVPEFLFAAIDGEGSPDGDVSASTIKHLFTGIYPIRQEARKQMGKALVEPPLEMLYWADDMRDLALGNKEKWKWRAMVMLPVWASEKVFSDSIAQAKKQVSDLPDTLHRVVFNEGKCAQIRQIGQLDTIPEKLEQLYTEFLPQNDLEPDGAYHEIYLDDWSRTPPERRKIILRQPCRHKL